MRISLLRHIALVGLAIVSYAHAQPWRRGQPALTDSLWQAKYRAIVSRADSVKYFDPEEAREVYYQIIRSNNEMLKSWAIRAAGSFADTSYGSSLLDILESNKAQSDLWHLAVAGLGDLRYRPAEELLVVQKYRLSLCPADHATGKYVLEKALEKIRGQGPGGQNLELDVEKIIKDSIDYFIRENDVTTKIIEALSYPGNSKAVGALSYLLKNPKIDVWARGYAAYGLGQIGDKRGIPALVDVCNTDTSDAVLSMAIEALGHLNAVQASGIVKKHINDQRPTVRRAAIITAGLIKSPELLMPLLGYARQEEEPQVQVYLVMALGQVSKNLVSPAQKELDKALRKAAREGKKVFLAFYCHQCTYYCPVMDSFLTRSEPMKSIMEKNYVYLKVDTVNKNGEQRLVDKYVGSEMEGHYPYYVIFDKSGKIMATSLVPGKGTVGWPEKDWEIAHFVETIKKTGKVKTVDLDVVARQMKERYENSE